MNLIGIEKGKYDLEGNLHFLPIECSFSPNTGLSYCSKLHGCNTTPCPSKTKDNNWVVFCMFKSRRCPSMSFNKQIYLALIKL